MPKRKQDSTGESALLKVHKGGIEKTKAKKTTATRIVAMVRARRAVTTQTPASIYFTDPVYGASTPTAGGTSMSVDIGPLQGGPGRYGSPPASNTPGNMRRLLDEYPAFGWVAGHLLNDNLGGPGIACNLTPLTTAGNKNHLVGIETTLKNSINAAFSRSGNYKSDAHWYGIHYRVSVSTDAWPDMPVFVATHLLVWAKVIRQSKQGGVLEDAPADTTPATVWFDPVAALKIDNPGIHAVDVV